MAGAMRQGHHHTATTTMSTTNTPAPPSTPPPRPRVLFVCTANAGRSPIAARLARERLAGQAVIESAGVEPWEHVHPMAQQVMAHRGLSLDDHQPRSTQAVCDERFDLVVTLSEPARSKLPGWLSQARRVHWGLPDPADADGTDRSEAAFRDTMAKLERRLPELEALLERWSAPLPRRQAGIGTGVWSAEPNGFEPARHLPIAADMGFAAIELSLFGPRAFDARDPARLDELTRVLDDCGMHVASIHAPDGGHLGARKPDRRQRQMDLLRWSIELADRFDAATVVSHALLLLGKDAPPEEPATEAQIAESLAELAPLVEPLATRIAFENGRGNQLGAFAADVLRRLPAHSDAAFGFALDTGHANIAGDLTTIVREVGHRLISLHLNDNDGQRDIHQPPGQGSVDWPAVIALLGELPFEGCIMYEIHDHGDANRALKQTIDWHHTLIAKLALAPSEAKTAS